MPRLFTAIELPEDIRADLRGLHLPLPNARWIKQSDYHLTLRFAGDISQTAARNFADELARIDADAFEIRLSGLGTFGGKDPKTVWAGIEPCPGLEALARAHEKAARSACLEPRKRNFAPHVTLARLNNSNDQALARFLSRFGGYRSEPVFVSQFVLMSSKPQTGGGPYGVVESFPLRGGYHLMEDIELGW